MATAYTVKAGDTLWALAQKYGTSVQAIAQASGISNPNRISVGQRISIPAVAADVPLPRPRPSIEASGLPIMSGTTANGSVVARPVLLASGGAQAGTGAGAAALPLMASSVGGGAAPSLTDVLASRYSSVAPSSPDASSYYGGDIASSLGGSNQTLDFVQPELSSIPPAQSSALQTALNTKAASMVPTLSASGAAYAGTDPPGQADLSGGDQKAQFVQSVYQAALASGMSDAAARVTATQAALESAYGTAAPGNNYFGIKAGSGWTGDTNYLPTTEYVNGQPTRTMGSFRAYDTPEQGMADRIALMDRAFPGFSQAQSIQDAYDALQNGRYGSYATTPASQYQSSLSWIGDHFLPQSSALDAISAATDPSNTPPMPRSRPDVTPAPSTGSGWLGNDVGTGPVFAALSAPTFDANVRSTPPATDFQLIGSPEWNAWEQSLPKSQLGQPTLTMPSFGGGGSGQGDQGPTALPIMASAAQPSYSPPTTAYTVKQMQVDNPAYLQYIAAQNADPIGAGPGSFGDLQNMLAATNAPAPPPRYITQSVRVPIMQASAPVVATPPPSDGGYFAGSPQAAMLQAAVSPMAGHGYDASEAGARSLAAMAG